MANLNPTTSATIIDFAAARRRRAQKPEPPEPFRPAGALRNVLSPPQHMDHPAWPVLALERCAGWPAAGGTKFEFER